MIEFITKYSGELIIIGSVLFPMVPLITKRIINDKNVLIAYDNIKTNVSSIFDESKRVATSVSHIEQLAKLTQENIIKADDVLNKKIEAVNKLIGDFQNDELYLELKDTLKTVKDLEAKIESKDQTIDYLTSTIKEIRKKLG